MRVCAFDKIEQLSERFFSNNIRDLSLCFVKWEWLFRTFDLTGKST